MNNIIVKYYISGLRCTSEIKARLKNENEELLKLQKELNSLKGENKEKISDKINKQKININNVKNGLIEDMAGLKHVVCVNGSWQNIISAYMNRGFVTTEGNDKQLEFIKGKIIEDIKSAPLVLIIGVSFGGMVANKLYEMLEDNREKVRVITINSIQISQNPKIVNYMHIGDLALKTSRLHTPPPRYLDSVIIKEENKEGQTRSTPLIRYSSKKYGNIIWYCYPSREQKTLGKCKHISHVSFLNPYSHRSSDYENIIDILRYVNERIFETDFNSFNSNLITLMKEYSNSENPEPDGNRDYYPVENYKTQQISTLREQRTRGGKLIKRNKTLKSYKLNIRRIIK